MVAKRQDGAIVVRFANSHRELKRVLADTAWTESYTRTLQRIPGSSKLDPRKFGSVSYRCVELPIDQVLT